MQLQQVWQSWVWRFQWGLNYFPEGANRVLLGYHNLSLYSAFGAWIMSCYIQCKAPRQPSFPCEGEGVGVSVSYYNNKGVTIVQGASVSF